MVNVAAGHAATKCLSASELDTPIRNGPLIIEEREPLNWSGPRKMSRNADSNGLICPLAAPDDRSAGQPARSLKPRKTPDKVRKMSAHNKLGIDTLETN